MVSAVMEAAAVKTLTHCRVCSGELEDIYRFRSVPLANRYCPPEEHECWYYPLTLASCGVCGLAQIREEVDRDALYSEYAYIPSTSRTMVAHFRDLAHAYAKADMFVVDIGSNDGTLLKEFQQLGCSVMGVEPAKNMAELAEHNGVHTVNAFWGGDIALTGADLITATNVVPNTTDLAGFLTAVYDNLGDAQFVVEVPDFERLIARGAYDAVYHEHMAYFTPVTLKNTLERYGLVVERMEHVAVHGGSLRATCRKGDPVEREAAIDYGWFTTQAKFRAEKVWTVLRDFAHEGMSVVGYGAPAKATVLLNEAEAKPEWMDYIVDSIPFKQGKRLPGLHIPIKPESELGEPDVVYVLAWNFAEEIKGKLAGRNVVVA